VRLRGNLLPLLDLASVLEIQQTYIDSERGTELHNRRKSIADRRSKQSPLFEKKAKDAEDESLPDGSQGDEEIKKDNTDRRTTLNRRFHANSAINIAVVSAGSFKYGLVVDRLRDSEEIVVKPIGRHLKKCHGYAGATIMGDGRVALILDVAGLAQMAELTSLEGTKRVGDAARQVKENISQESDKERASLLLFRNGAEEQFSVPLSLVERIERINVTNIENVGGKKVIQYRKGTLPLFTLDQVATVQSLPERKQLEVIIFTLAGREVGLMVTPPVDAVEVSVNIDPTTLKQPGIMGSSIINEHTTLMVDMFEIIKTLHPEWFDEKESERMSGDKEFTVLFAEDSDFFRNQVTGFLEDDGYKVFAFEDGAIALDHLSEHADEIDIVLTDIEMPNMDGFELTRRIKEDERFKHLRVIALTSLAGDEDIARGEKAGIDDYQIKLDREKLLESVRNYLKKMG
jgi:two-component system chemotaxis sensor kinase CheA